MECHIAYVGEVSYVLTLTPLPIYPGCTDPPVSKGPGWDWNPHRSGCCVFAGSDVGEVFSGGAAESSERVSTSQRQNPRV